MFITRIFFTPRSIKKLLVANRGEIACRIFRTCSALGIKTVAIYCDAEQNSKHVQMADDAIRIGPPPASTSYLRGDLIIEAAKKLEVDAIHPGYGFLSEHADFADAVTKAGFTFIGPPASAITAMGSKSESKHIMSKAGVPIVPGYHGDNQNEAFLAKQADKVGYPLLIKAVSGGGGKGMKIVRKKEEFMLLLHSAKREGFNFFKDDRMILERFIERSRHVECQIFCDGKGGNVFFFERDCSVQRRYQKVLEEAPAPGLTEETRAHIGKIAVKAAEAVGYVGAGTVEFILDDETGEFFFMEMNTRLQVEHPVSEEVCRIKGQPVDFVQLQIETAEGRPFRFKQNDISLVGACIEARIYAENPSDNFLPCSGHLNYMKEPNEFSSEALKIRVDTGFRSGDDVLVHYDPMIAKLVIWGEDRATALRGLKRSLADYHVVGIPTNIQFLQHCCENQQFIDGGVTTKFISENLEQLLRRREIPTEYQALIAWVKAMQYAHPEGGFRLNHLLKTSQHFLAPNYVDDKKEQDILRFDIIQNNNVYTVTCIGTLLHHEIVPTNPRQDNFLAVCIDNVRRYEFKPIVSHNFVSLLLANGTFTMNTVPLPKGFGDVQYKVGKGSTVNAPMPGKVGKLLVAENVEVKQGQSVLVLEAMKMEHIVKSPSNGVIKFLVKEGHMAGPDEELASIVIK